MRLPLNPGRARATMDEGKPKRAAKYREDFIRIASSMGALGATNAELARAFGVRQTTIIEWCKTYPKFGAALKAAKDEADLRVERSLYERATGYSYKAQKAMQFQGAPVVVEYVEHCPPDVMAGMYWLNNRQREKWRRAPEAGGIDTPPPVKVEILVKDASTPEPEGT